MHDHFHDTDDLGDPGRPRRGPGRRGAMGPFGGPFGPFGGPFAHGHGRARGRGRQRRGDVRAAVLLVLEEEPRNGYQIIQELTDRSHEAWRPSPGSVYPVLQQLEDEGLIETVPSGSGRTFRLTSAGSALVAERREELGRPWEDAAEDLGGPARELISTMRQVILASRQVLMAGSEAQVERGTAVLAEARRALYAMLAEADQ